MTGVISTNSSGYMTVLAANTTRVYPSDLVGGTTTAAGSSIFDSDSRVVVTHIVPMAGAQTSGTIALGNHAGTAIETYPFGVFVTGRWVPVGNGMPFAGLSAIAAGGVAAADINVYFTILKR